MNNSIKAIFIRAPKFTRVGDNVEILAKINNSPVLVRQDTILVSSFHPELTEDYSVHKYFLNM